MHYGFVFIFWKREQYRVKRDPVLVVQSRIEYSYRTYLLGFLDGAPFAGLSVFACTTLTAPVAGSFSKDVAVIGKGAFNKPTVLPGANR